MFALAKITAKREEAAAAEALAKLAKTRAPLETIPPRKDSTSTGGSAITIPNTSDTESSSRTLVQLPNDLLDHHLLAELDAAATAMSTALGSQELITLAILETDKAQAELLAVAKTALIEASNAKFNALVVAGRQNRAFLGIPEKNVSPLTSEQRQTIFSILAANVLKQSFSCLTPIHSVTHCANKVWEGIILHALNDNLNDKLMRLSHSIKYGMGENHKAELITAMQEDTSVAELILKHTIVTFSLDSGLEELKQLRLLIDELAPSQQPEFIVEIGYSSVYRLGLNKSEQTKTNEARARYDEAYAKANAHNQRIEAEAKARKEAFTQIAQEAAKKAAEKTRVQTAERTSADEYLAWLEKCNAEPAPEKAQTVTEYFEKIKEIRTWLTTSLYLSPETKNRLLEQTKTLKTKLRARARQIKEAHDQRERARSTASTESSEPSSPSDSSESSAASGHSETQQNKPPATQQERTTLLQELSETTATSVNFDPIQTAAKMNFVIERTHTTTAITNLLNHAVTLLGKQTGFFCFKKDDVLAQQKGIALFVAVSKMLESNNETIDTEKLKAISYAKGYTLFTRRNKFDPRSTKTEKYAAACDPEYSSSKRKQTRQPTAH